MSQKKIKEIQHQFSKFRLILTNAWKEIILEICLVLIPKWHNYFSETLKNWSPEYMFLIIPSISKKYYVQSNTRIQKAYGIKQFIFR